MTRAERVIRNRSSNALKFLQLFLSIGQHLSFWRWCNSEHDTAAADDTCKSQHRIRRIRAHLLAFKEKGHERVPDPYSETWLRSVLMWRRLSLVQRLVQSTVGDNGWINLLLRKLLKPIYRQIVIHQVQRFDSRNRKKLPVLHVHKPFNSSQIEFGELAG